MQSEAMVNTGPALFISPSGPNPLMVQAIFSISPSKKKKENVSLNFFIHIF